MSDLAADLIPVLDSTLRLSTPLLLACLAGLFSERAGVFDLGLEGKMLAAAFFSAAIAFLTDSVWTGLAAGILASVSLALLHGLASITFRGNQLISGIAINFLAVGLTALIARSWFGLGGHTPALDGNARFDSLAMPFEGLIAQAPLVGPLYAELISGHTILVYLSLGLVPTTWWILYRTRLGLRLRAAGEAPDAVESAGISVVSLRYIAVILCGVLCGLAGAYMATGLHAGFVNEMTAGRGFIALAALIFAKWRPYAALWSCLLFGFLQALSLRPDLFERHFSISLQLQLLDALPYILTVVILAGFVGKAVPPRACGVPYAKGGGG
ncbi:MAG: ABC transporter permease [Ectothiorhodospiraceae bacterium AqS1]|nr:ABC transporter permease [Ectothiorhodospiraceae bacterium AqS1]